MAYEADRERLSKKIVRGYWPSVDIGDGWMPIVIALDQKLSEAYPEYAICQIKEKFGGLRFYVDGVPYKSQGDEWINEAEALSFKTCEDCGKPGELTNSGGYWVKTLCKEHDEERIARRKMTGTS